MKHLVILLTVLCLMARCCSTPNVENGTSEMDLKIQQLEKRIDQLEKHLNELDSMKVLPLK